MSSQRLTYTDIEIRGYLPSGWGILAGSIAKWDAERSRWQISVYDGAENEWPLVVDAKQANEKGRLGALRQSVDALYRKALA